MPPPIYLDYNSTTPLDPRVLEAMIPFFLEKFGNTASESHVYGWEASNAVEKARQSIALGIGAKDGKHILFTSGATESNNLVILGLARGAGRPIHIITQQTEHACVLEACRAVQREGHEVTILPVDGTGLVNPDDVRKAIRKNTLLCSIMAANNEIGTLQPIQEIGSLCREKGILFHTDAVQAVGKIPMDVEKSAIDFLSLSGHKMYGPKGIGALFISPQGKRHTLAPLLYGGNHERGLRSGTLNVPGIVGLEKALQLSLEEMSSEAARLTALRDTFIRGLQEGMDQTVLNGHPTLRLPNNINISFLHVASEDLIKAVPRLALSSGSACASGSTEPSHVLRAIGADELRLKSSIRVGLGRGTTKEDVAFAVSQLIGAANKLRSQSLTYEMSRNKIHNTP